MLVVTDMRAVSTTSLLLMLVFAVGLAAAETPVPFTNCGESTDPLAVSHVFANEVRLSLSLLASHSDSKFDVFGCFRLWCYHMRFAVASREGFIAHVGFVDSLMAVSFVPSPCCSLPFVVRC